MNVLSYLWFLFSQAFSKKDILTARAGSIFKIDYSRLKKKKIHLLIFDIDDTLTAHLEPLPKRTLLLLRTLTKKGFSIAIMSNRKPKENRIHEELGELPVFVEKTSTKPSRDGYTRVLSHLKEKPENTAMIGDRPGTDMWGAYRAGLKELILVEPYSDVFGGRKADMVISIFRRIEKRWLI